ncbi:MAG: phosphoribosylglycinamide formyltransferase [Breznakibacter sp.]
MKRIAIFASGSGSNAEKIAEHFKNHPNVKICFLLSNKKDALALVKAKEYGVPTVVFGRDEFYNSTKIVDLLIENQIDLLVLAGFLWLVPALLVRAFEGRIVNIHPALLPKYGGKGMYGNYVHEAVVANNERESGITIHYVNDHYDEGDIILQVSCPIDSKDTPEDVARKVHELEYEHFPKTIASILGE